MIGARTLYSAALLVAPLSLSAQQYGVRDTTAVDSARDPVAAAARAYWATGEARPVVQGSFVVFPYGHSQPVLTCAVLRACVVELEAGEVVLSRVAGDTERWEVVAAPAGADGRTTLVVVKPRDCDVTTNLVLATDRRVYDLTLDSPPCRGKVAGSAGGAGVGAASTTNPQQPYVRHVRFYYPDETAVTVAPPTRSLATVEPDPLALNFRYRVRKDRKFPWPPAQVFDDGARLYVRLPDEARHGAAPVMFELAADGSKALLNYAVVGDTYVTDRLVDRAVLVAADGAKAHTAVIEREGAGGGR